MGKDVSLFWFRQDLRITDNPGLLEAAKHSHVIPIYILDDETPGEFKMGGASRSWLHGSLTALNESLDNQLNCYVGNAKTILLNLIKENNVSAVYWNRCYEPWQIQQDQDIQQTISILKDKALQDDKSTVSEIKNKESTCKTFNSALLWEPNEVLKADGSFYKVFTPFYKRCLQTQGPRSPLPKPKRVHYVKIPQSLSIESLPLIPKQPWVKTLSDHCKPGEAAALKRLQTFIAKGLPHYKMSRDFPALASVSGLSPYLHFGEISPHQVWSAVQSEANEARLTAEIEHFSREIIWREFSTYMLFHFPELPRKNFQSKFDAFPWAKNAKVLTAWQMGQTGIPIVDAGMRELWQTGTMHNRVRMIVASFLVKNARIHWSQGERWFWDCLVDADLASNSFNWQWVAGSGVDAAPYFRIFNPVLQGEKFDKNGEYTKRYLPELAKLPSKYLFKPWEAPENVLKDAGIELGKTYPKPVVDLAESRNAALKAYKSLPRGE